MRDHVPFITRTLTCSAIVVPLTLCPFPVIQLRCDSVAGISMIRIAAALGVPAHRLRHAAAAARRAVRTALHARRDTGGVAHHG